jgi:hypothetical protein
MRRYLSSERVDGPNGGNFGEQQRAQDFLDEVALRSYHGRFDPSSDSANLAYQYHRPALELGEDGPADVGELSDTQACRTLWTQTVPRK